MIVVGRCKPDQRHSSLAFIILQFMRADMYVACGMWLGHGCKQAASLAPPRSFLFGTTRLGAVISATTTLEPSLLLYELHI